MYCLILPSAAAKVMRRHRLWSVWWNSGHGADTQRVSAAVISANIRSG